MSNSKLFFVFFSIFVSFVVSRDRRKEEFERIKKYELVHFNFSLLSSSNIISFDAFGDHYEMELTLNEHLNPSSLHHTNGNIAVKRGLDQFYTHLTESCHYFGKVLNDNTSSSVALSICDKRGIRGTVSAFGHTISIKPKKYYDAEYDRANYHDHHDEHLVYKMNDFDNSGSRGKSHKTDLNKDSKSHKTDLNKKRRLKYNNNDNVLEVYTVVDKYYTDWQIEYYPNNWYDQMVADFADLWNGVSEQYKNPKFCACPLDKCPLDLGKRNCKYEAWSDQLEGITIIWVGLEVATNWDGIYSQLKPGRYVWEGKNYVDSQNGLSKLQAFVKNNFFANGERPNFDQVTGFSEDDQSDGYWWFDTGGIAYFATMCETEGWATALVSTNYNLASWVSLTAHELGHNFGSAHDAQGDNDCHADAGNMGYGEAQNGWSECTRGYINKYFEDMDGLTCLSKRDPPRAFTQKLNGNTDITTSPTPSPTDGTPGFSGCVGIGSFNERPALNGNWPEDTWQINGKSSYKKGPYTLHWNSGSSQWWINEGDDRTDEGQWAYCNSVNVEGCSGQWNIWVLNGGAWTPQQSAATMGGCNGPSPTATTTKAPTSTDIDPPTTTTTSKAPTTAITPAPTTATTVGTPGISGCFRIGSFNEKPDLNGNWQEQSGNINGKPSYKKGPYILHWNSGSSQWWINEGDDMTDDGQWAYCGKGDVEECSGKWVIWVSENGGWIAHVSMVATVSGCNGGMEVAECLEYNKYNDNLCVYNNGSIWKDEGNEHKEFTLSGICKNGEPLYQHVVYDEDSEDTVDTTYYLYYRTYWKYMDDVFKSGQWQISINSTDDNVAWCDHDDLQLCIEGNWATQSFEGDSARYAVEENMAVLNEECMILNAAKSQDSKMSVNEIVAIAMVVAAVIIGCGILIYWRYVVKKKKEDKMKHFELREEEMVPTELQEEEIEVDVQVETKQFV